MAIKINTELQNELSKILDKDSILYNEVLKNHSYFKIGGEADVLLLPKTIEEVVESYLLCKNAGVAVTFIGNGSNILFSDLGVRGAVIKIADNLSGITVKDDTITAEAGASMVAISDMAIAHSLSGYEFASGIPGTVGGAVYMNAGAYDGEMSQVVTAVTVMHQDGSLEKITTDFDFRYRGSRIQDQGDIALAVEIKLRHGVGKAIQARVDELSFKRQSKQPLQMPSAGSTFKRPEGYYAGKLIDDSGLRGFRYKRAAISEKHCGFVVNLGGATAEEVTILISMVQTKVYEKFGVKLEPEVRMIGEGFQRRTRGY